MMNQKMNVSKGRRLCGWLIHGFTASGAIVGVLSLDAIFHQQIVHAFWLMIAAIFIDAVDGLFARMIKIKTAVPEINGELLDNIVDFLNYTIVPAFFLLESDILPAEWCLLSVIAIILSSAYQFTQVDAKTDDHFFKGFPSYWNIVVFYLFFWQMNPWINMSILLSLSILSFVPIKYVYPSRMDYLSHNVMLRFSMLLATIVWGLVTAALLWIYPETNLGLVLVSMAYLVIYVGISVYRTWVPLAISKSL